MARATPQIAKLLCPVLHSAVPRTQLLPRLDELRERCTSLHVSGPPGAGKTALVASWVRERRAPSIWFQIDASDATLPTFFHYLATAASPFRRRNQPDLPPMSPEYLGDIAGFAKRFFEELFTRLPSRGMVIFDNCHEVAVDHPLHRILAEAADQVPPEKLLVTISRRPAGPEHSRAIAGERMGVLGWDDLRLSADEARAIARHRGWDDFSCIDNLHSLSAGWAAGLTLLLERSSYGMHVPDADDPETYSRVFDYFAGQLFDGLDAPVQDQLLRMGLLPRISEADAVEITGADSAPALLRDLHRRQLFTDRALANGPVYQFHALFRDFLNHRAALTIRADDLAATVSRAAALAERGTMPEDAVALYLRAGDLQSARRVIVREAPRLIGQGRWGVVVDWIGALPSAMTDGDAWLLYWLGTARASVSPSGGRESLAAAFALSGDDRACHLMCAAAIAETHILEYASFRLLDPWIGVLEVGLPGFTGFENDTSELRVLSAFLIALAYRRPESPAIKSCTDRVVALISTDAPVSLRVTAGAYLVAYGTTTGPLDVAHAAAPTLEVLLRHPDASPLSAAWASFILAHYYILIGKEEKSHESSDRVEAIASRKGLHFVIALAFVMRGWLNCQMGNQEVAAENLARMDAQVDRSRSYDLASLHSLRMLTAYLTGNAERALVEGRRAVDLFDAAGSIMHRLLNRDIMASAALSLDRPADAGELLAELRRISRGVRPTWLEGRITLHEALAKIELGQTDSGLADLRHGLKFVQDHRTEALLRFARPVMPKILAHALRARIEVPYVRELIRTLDLPAPAPDLEDWPWPVRIWTLGRFEVEVDGAPLRFSHKQPRKPFLLLKALIALGGRDVREESIQDALWPQESGDAAHEAFGQALMRLRRLLKCPAAITLAGGRLTIDRSRVWIDVDAFDLASRDAADTATDRPASLALYGGEFLPDELELPWTAGLRERLRLRFINGVSAQGKRLEVAHDWESALRLYSRGIDADGLAEAFHQGVMRAHAALGRRAEALAAYRRLRQQLAIVLGIEPSASTVALARSLSEG